MRGNHMREFILNDGSKLPQIGFGTYNEEFKDNKEAILTAIDCGYRFFDTASLYETAWLGEHPDFVIPDRKSNPNN